MKTDTCIGCRFWQGRIGDPDADTTGFQWREGECRRYAPFASIHEMKESGRKVYAGADNAWPITHRADWCGEFEAIPLRQVLTMPSVQVEPPTPPADENPGREVGG